MESKKCCEACGLSKQRKCSVCGVTYEGRSKLHLQTQSHKLYKQLFNALREVNQDEIEKLSKKYVKASKLQKEVELPKKKTQAK